MQTRRTFILKLAASCIASPTLARAQTNKRPITVVVPYPPGGSSDVLGRIFSNALAMQIGEPVIIENRHGANGVIGAQYVSRMPGDGRTMLYTLGNLLLNQEFLSPGVEFRPVQSLMPFAKTTDLQVAIVAPAAHPANDIREFIEMAKHNPGKYSYAYYGDLGIISLAIEAGIDILRVPYRGGPIGILDVIAGRVDIIASSLTQASPLLKSDKLKVLAVMTDSRWSEYPDVPTVKEVLPGYNSLNYNGIFLPKNTPDSVADSLWKVCSLVLSEPDYRAQVSSRGALPSELGPKEFDRYFNADYENIKATVKIAGIQPE